MMINHVTTTNNELFLKLMNNCMKQMQNGLSEVNVMEVNMYKNEIYIYFANLNAIFQLGK